MSSALVWLPPGKYGSVEPLWQNQYVWSPLPVDSSLPLHQTSFLDIDEGEAAAARSSANTLASESKALLTDPGSSVTQAGDAEGEYTPTPGITRPEQQVAHRALKTIRQSRNNPRPPAELRAAVAKLLVPRPSSLKETRLHSFHLGSNRDGEPYVGVAKPPLGTPQTSQNGEFQHVKLVENAVIKTKQADEVEERSESSTTKTRRAAKAERFEAQPLPSVKPPKGRSRTSWLAKSQTGEIERHEADTLRNVTTEKPTKQPRSTWLEKPRAGRTRTPNTSSNIIVKRGRRSPPTQESLPSPVASADARAQEQTKPKSQTMFTLHVNLEIEIQLKACIKGDLTLTLFE